MSTLQSLKNYIDGFPERKDFDFLADIRKDAHDRYRRIGFPDRRHEAWKYLDLKPILEESYGPAVQENASSVFNGWIKECSLENAFPFHFRNGFYVNAGSDSGKVMDTGYFEILSKAWESPHGMILHQLLHSDLETEENPFALANLGLLTDGGFWVIPKDAKLSRPIHIISGVEGITGAVMANPHFALVLEDGAEAQLVLDEWTPENQSLCGNTFFKIMIGKNAKLNVTHIRHLGNKTNHFFTQKVYMEEGGEFKSISFHLGASTSRCETAVILKAQKANAAVKGFSLLEDKNRLYQHVLLDHRAPGGISRQVFKNILNGESLSEFNSVVHVRRNAQASDTEQMNRNLLLSGNARALSRPQLKIYTDDVKCNHGSANGQMQDEELFYLRSRGLDLKMAKFLLMFGFAEEIIEEIQNAEVRERLERLVRKKLEAMILK